MPNLLKITNTLPDRDFCSVMKKVNEQKYVKMLESRGCFAGQYEKAKEVSFKIIDCINNGQYNNENGFNVIRIKEEDADYVVY